MQLVVMFTLLFTFTVPTQQKSDDWAKMGDGKSNSPNKEAKELAKQDDRFTVIYDRFRDETRLQSGWIDFNSPSRATIRPNSILVCRFKGNGTKGQPEECYMLIELRSKTWRFLRSHNLIMLIDGKQQDFGEVAHDGELAKGNYAGVVETMLVPLNPDLIKQIAGAQKLEMKLGRYEYFFTPGNFAVFKAMATRLQVK
jgi:hypothetical protein